MKYFTIGRQTPKMYCINHIYQLDSFRSLNKSQLYDRYPEENKPLVRNTCICVNLNIKKYTYNIRKDYLSRKSATANDNGKKLSVSLSEIATLLIFDDDDNE